MKKIYTIMLAALLGGIAAQAQEADYQPLVREGVRWIYYTFVSAEGEIFDTHYYAIEFSGEKTINENDNLVTYKNCYSFYIDKDNYFAPQDFSEKIAGYYMREEGKKVYCLDYDAMKNHRPSTVLYDFSNSEQAVLGFLGADVTIAFDLIGTETIGDHECRVFSAGNDACLVESIGLVSRFMGDLTGASLPVPSIAQTNYGLCCVIDADGNIIYRGPNWHFFASDLNGDCKVDIADVSQAVNAILGRSDNPGTDINGDGKVDIGDVNAVINAMLGRE